MPSENAIARSRARAAKFKNEAPHSDAAMASILRQSNRELSCKNTALELCVSNREKALELELEQKDRKIDQMNTLVNSLKIDAAEHLRLMGKQDENIEESKKAFNEYKQAASDQMAQLQADLLQWTDYGQKMKTEVETRGHGMDKIREAKLRMDTRVNKLTLEVNSYKTFCDEKNATISVLRHQLETLGTTDNAIAQRLFKQAMMMSAKHSRELGVVMANARKSGLIDDVFYRDMFNELDLATSNLSINKPADHDEFTVINSAKIDADRVVVMVNSEKRQFYDSPKIVAPKKHLPNEIPETDDEDEPALPLLTPAQLKKQKRN